MSSLAAVTMMQQWTTRCLPVKRMATSLGLKNFHTKTNLLLGQKRVQELLESNRRWVQERLSERPEFFSNFETQQPKYLWIGCSDSRVPPAQILGLGPGDIFVTRNIANIVSPDDISVLSVLEFAVDVLKVEHVIVCGHDKCGGIMASLNEKTPTSSGIIDHWIAHIRHLRDKNKHIVKHFEGNKDDLVGCLVRLNVEESVRNDAVVNTETIQNAWARGQTLAVHGWLYDHNTGLVHDLQVSMSNESTTEGEAPEGSDQPPPATNSP